MAKINFSDCKYFIYAHYNDYHDVNDITLRDALKRYQISRFSKKECGFITGCRNAIELDYICRILDNSKDVDYVILEQMSLWDLN